MSQCCEENVDRFFQQGRVKEALAWLRKGVDLNNERCVLLLEEHGLQVAVSAEHKAELAVDPSARWFIAYCKLYGYYGYQQDLQQAYLMLCEQPGHAFSWSLRGECLRHGEGVRSDARAAMACFVEAARRGLDAWEHAAYMATWAVKDYHKAAIYYNRGGHKRAARRVMRLHALEAAPWSRWTAGCVEVQLTQLAQVHRAQRTGMLLLMRARVHRDVRVMIMAYVSTRDGWAEIEELYSADAT